MLTKLGVAALLCTSLSFAGTVVYTSSAAFELATSISQTEDYGAATLGDLASGATLDGLTYSNFVLTNGGTDLYIVAGFNDFSGKSLGADHVAALGPTATFFFGTEGATITFAAPVNAFGMFFNVNANSGTYGFTSSSGSAFSDSTAYDTSTFVFAGIISDTPFGSISFSSTDATLGVYNVPELLVGPAADAATTPEPSTIVMLAGGLLLIAAAGRRHRRA